VEGYNRHGSEPLGSINYWEILKTGGFLRRTQFHEDSCKINRIQNL
jgi:hypothetical protein